MASNTPSIPTFPTSNHFLPVWYSHVSMPNKELGNECAVRTVAGPGGSRTVSPTGGQGQHGPVEGRVKPEGRDILSEYGKESSTAAGRMKR
jgi:hypothetical protein